MTADRSEARRALEVMFGPFAPVFEPGEDEVAGYLVLLHLRSAGVQDVIDRIAVVLRTEDSRRWFPALLQDVNWRPHLVAAIAVMLEPTLDFKLLWDAIDRGSWVIPQLVVTAAFVDPRFCEHARARVDALGPIAVPDGHAARRAKMVGSVIAMAAEFPQLGEWRASVLGDERIQPMLALDASWNSSDKIVARWLAGLREAFQARGRTLSLPG